MTRSLPVLHYWKLGFDIWRMSAEAQGIMMMRMAGMAGLWTLAPGETTRMVSEKQEAFAHSMMCAGTKALQGQRPDQVMRAALDPVRRKTSGNSRRLGKSMRRQMF
jgi:hypothetical protein